MNWKLLFNPFEKIPEKLLLLLGIISFIIGCYFSYQFEMIFDGIFDAHEFSGILFSQAFTANAVNVITVCVFLFILGKIINPKTRMIDILNTAFISRIPIYLTAPLAAVPVVKQITEKIVASLKDIENMKLGTLDMMVLLSFSGIAMLLLVYSIVLLANGFRTATNAKKWQHYVIFGLVLLLAEIVSKGLISLL